MKDSSFDDREAISVLHLVIIKLEVSTCPIVVIFPLIVCRRWLYHYNLPVSLYLSQENWVFFSVDTVQSVMCANAFIDTLRPRQNRRHFADDVFKCNFLNENVWIPIKSSLKFVPQGPVNNIAALVQIMAWRRPVDKPLSEPMIVSLPTHICITRPQWVKTVWFYALAGTLLHVIIIIMQSCLKAFNIQNACQIYSVKCVSKMKSILTIILYAIYGALCYQLVISLMMIPRIFVLHLIIIIIIIIKLEIWFVSHCLRLDHETMAGFTKLKLLSYLLNP